MMNSMRSTTFRAVRKVPINSAACSISLSRPFSLNSNTDVKRNKPINDPNTVHPNDRLDPAAIQAEIIKLKEELKRRELARKNKSSMQLFGIGAFALNEILGGVLLFGLMVGGCIYVFDIKDMNQAKEKILGRFSSKEQSAVAPSSDAKPTDKQ